MRYLFPLFALLVCASCVNLTWDHQRKFTPLSGASIGQLSVGSSGLDDALDALGAPLYVWERPRDGFALAYGGYEGRDLGLRVSVPIVGRQSASFNYNDVQANLYGVVLFFDQKGQLELVREGYLSDIAPGLDRRRASFDQDEPAEADS